ncbi:MAG: MOSC domain-containing protein [Woeseiaceae bacterium]|nr:MOSC domain-containing protein [Woeseiaceae bacterium]
MRLESVNVGLAETIAHGNKSMATGICKRPVSGPVAVTEEGIPGDTIVATEHHGGSDQAIYAYSADDYEWWAEATDKEYPAGLFGENLTIRDLPSDMRVGDRLLIGEVVLEATAPRIPCDTLATRMQDRGFGMAFRKAERPGIYFRVLNEGDIQAGDNVTLVESDSCDVTILDLFRYKYSLRHEPDDLRRFLEAPLASRFRVRIEADLAALQ